MVVTELLNRYPFFSRLLGATTLTALGVSETDSVAKAGLLFVLFLVGLLLELFVLGKDSDGDKIPDVVESLAERFGIEESEAVRLYEYLKRKSPDRLRQWINLLN